MAVAAERLREQGPYLTVEEAAEYLRRAPATIRDLVRRRILIEGKHFRRPGGPRSHPLFVKVELDRWLTECSPEPAARPSSSRPGGKTNEALWSEAS